MISSVRTTNSHCAFCASAHPSPKSIPCSGQSAARCGETCTDIPDTLRVLYDDVNLCRTASIGTGVPVEKAVNMCPCLTKVVDFLEEFEEEPARWRTSAITAGGNIADCLINQGK